MEIGGLQLNNAAVGGGPRYLEQALNRASSASMAARDRRTSQDGIELNELPATISMMGEGESAASLPRQPTKVSEANKAWYASILGTKNRKTTDLLASNAWSSANINQLRGMLARLKMIEESGMPAMRLLPMKTLQSLGRIPRSTENCAVNALDAVANCGEDEFGHSKAVLVFFSHRWLRADYCSALSKDLAWGTPERIAALEQGLAVGEPDCENHQKAKALIEWGEWFKWWRRSSLHPYFKDITRAEDMEIFFWIDWPCVDQTNPGPDMTALPAVVGACSVLLSYAGEEYRRRAWCQVELLMAYAYMNTGAVVFGLTEGFAHNSQPACHVEDLTVTDPRLGNLTNQHDRKIIDTLQQAAVESNAFSCFRVFVRMSTESPAMCLLYNCVGAAGCCGFVYWRFSRQVQLGKSVQRLIIPETHAYDGTTRRASFEAMEPGLVAGDSLAAQ